MSETRSYNQKSMAIASRPKTKKLTADEKAMIAAAKEARAQGNPIEPVVFSLIQGKAAQGAYLNAHL